MPKSLRHVSLTPFPYEMRETWLRSVSLDPVENGGNRKRCEAKHCCTPKAFMCVCIWICRCYSCHRKRLIKISCSLVVEMVKLRTGQSTSWISRGFYNASHPTTPNDMMYIVFIQMSLWTLANVFHFITFMSSTERAQKRTLISVDVNYFFGIRNFRIISK